MSTRRAQRCCNQPSAAKSMNSEKVLLMLHNGPYNMEPPWLERWQGTNEYCRLDQLPEDEGDEAPGPGLGFRAHSLRGFRVWDLRFNVQGLGVKVGGGLKTVGFLLGVLARLCYYARVPFALGYTKTSHFGPMSEDGTLACDSCQAHCQHCFRFIFI